MGLYNFKAQFRPMIEDGTKCHTIRSERKHADKPGCTMHLYTGLRTKHSSLIFRAPCVKVQSVALYRAGLWLDGEELSLSEKDGLAWRDGFRYPGALLNPKACFDLMLRFWAKNHSADRFEGRMYHWDFERRTK